MLCKQQQKKIPERKKSAHPHKIFYIMVIIKDNDNRADDDGDGARYLFLVFVLPFIIFQSITPYILDVVPLPLRVSLFFRGKAKNLNNEILKATFCNCADSCTTVWAPIN
jgi:hypothetical protein